MPDLSSLTAPFDQARASIGNTLARARAVLQKDKCKELFGSGIDPQDALNKLYGNIGVLSPPVSFIRGKPVASSFTYDWLIGNKDAATDTGILNLVIGWNDGKPYIGPGIRVYVGVNNFNSSGTSLQAAVLLHELGHVLTGLGATGVQFVDDTGDSGASQANTLNILQNCGLVQ